MPLSSAVHTDSLMGNEKLKKIKDVQIFKAGTWNGKTITEDDLDKMVQAFSETKPKGVAPFIKLGHNDEQAIIKSSGEPAAGWIENVKRVGNALYCDFVDIPKKIFEAIKNKAYRKVSIEMLNNFEIDGKKYPKFLYAVSLLGAELPAVSTLDDILARYSYEEMVKFAQDLDSDIIEIVESENREKDSTMDEMEKLKFQLEEMAKQKCALEGKAGEAEELAKALEAVKLQIAALEEQIKVLSEEKMEMAKKVAATEMEKKEAKLNEFVAKLGVSKAMEPFVRALAGEEKETYSIDEKTMDKFSLIENIVSLATEAAKVNFSENTSKITSDEMKGKTKEEVIESKINSLMKENPQMKYRDAYSLVAKEFDLTAPTTQEEA